MNDDTPTSKTRIHWGSTVHKYEVTGVPPTMSDSELINWCDGGDRNFGGQVTRRDDNTANVHVYID